MVGLPLFGKEGSGTTIFKILVKALPAESHNIYHTCLKSLFFTFMHSYLEGLDAKILFGAIIYFFVGFVALCPSQQLWSCQDGQFT